MIRQSIKSKIFVLFALAPCLAAVSLWAQQMGGPGGLGAVAPMPMLSNPPAAPSSMNDDPAYVQKDAMIILQEKEILRDLAINGQAETGLSQLAVTNTSNAYVKSLAKVILVDHQVMDAEVTAAATKLKVKLPQEPSGHLRKQEKKMQALTGSDFDQAYLKELDHDVTVDGKRAKIGTQSTDSPDIRQLMAKVYNVSESLNKVILDVGKAESLNLK